MAIVCIFVRFWKSRNSTLNARFSCYSESLINYLIIMSCADSGNFLWKKFHKTSHTLHSLITCKLNLKQPNSRYISRICDCYQKLMRSDNGCFVICFANKLLLISLSWQFDYVISYFYLLIIDSEKAETLRCSLDFLSFQNDNNYQCLKYEWILLQRATCEKALHQSMKYEWILL